MFVFANKVLQCRIERNFKKDHIIQKGTRQSYSKSGVAKILVFLSSIRSNLILRRAFVVASGV